MAIVTWITQWMARLIAWFTRLIGRLGWDASTAPATEEVLADHLTLTIQCVRDIRRQVAAARDSTLLAEHQCGDLSSKLLRAIGNIQELVSQFEASSAITFRPALQDFHRIAEKSRSLVSSCARGPDWCRASVFQIQNEEAFREILLEVGLCYNVIYEQAKAMSGAEGLDLEVEDLRQGRTFAPTSPLEVAEDQKALQRRLEDLAKNSGSSPDHILARYLLRRLLEGVSQKQHMIEDACIMYDASISRVTEMELKGTWDPILRPLGGGSGAYCVFSTEWLGISCAKKLFLYKEQDPIFRKEAALLASLNHPNIVKFFCCGSGVEGDHRTSCFIAMELMEMSLDDLIKDRVNRKLGRFPMAVALDIIIQIARGMLYLHDLRIAHRDLKPQNVVVSRLAPNNTLFVKLLDFGMSRTKIQVSKSNTVSFKNIGTTTYRAPEAFSDAAHLSDAAHGKQKVKWFRADVYSFAVTCYAILSLEQPYANYANAGTAKAGTNAANRLYKKLMTGTRPELPADCPETLSDLLKECWAVNLNARPKFSNICERLEKFKHDQLLKGPAVTTIAATESAIAEPRAAGERGDGVAVPSGYKYIETMLSEHSQLRTPVQHVLATVVPSDDEAAANDLSDDELESFEAPTNEGMDLEWISLQKKTFIVSKAQGADVDETMKQTLKKACEDFCKDIDLTRIPTTEERGQAMQDIVAHLRSIFPKYNALVVYPSHQKHFMECAHCSVTLKIAEFKMFTVQVYVFKRGNFTLNGDAGFINWCFSGNHHRNNYKVTFWDIQDDSVVDGI